MRRANACPMKPRKPNAGMGCARPEQKIAKAVLLIAFALLEQVVWRANVFSRRNRGPNAGTTHVLPEKKIVVAARVIAPAPVVPNASPISASPKTIAATTCVHPASRIVATARATAPAMIEAGEGAIIVTGNTSALRGKANYAFFAPTKAAQRILAQSMARELGPKGVHVAYVLIDASIDTPWTRHLGPKDMPEDYFCKPPAIAETIYHIAHQERSAWTFDVDLRPFGESW